MNERAGQWINVILALLLLVGIALTVFAVNQVKSINSEAKGKPGGDTTASNECKSSVLIDNKGISVGETNNHSIRLCEGTSMVSWLNWGKKIDKSQDLALKVTSPDGTVFTQDEKNTATEVYIRYGGDKEGIWLFEVKNVGTKSSRYDLAAGVGTN